MTKQPVGWTRARLGVLGRWVGGGTPSKRVPTFWTGEIPWVSPKDMKVPRIRETKDHITREAVDRSAASLVPPGSVLVVTRSGILRHSLPVAVADREVAVNQDLKVLVATDGVVPEYVAWALRSFADQILHTCAKSGTTVQNLDTAKLLDFEIPVAPSNEQRRIVAAIEEQFSRLDAGEDSLGRCKRRLAGLVRVIRSLAVAEGEERTVGELLDDIEAGKSFRCHPRRANDDEWGVIKVSAMTWGTFNDTENKAVLSDDHVDPRWEIKRGDLLLSRANTTEYVGATVLVRRCRPRLLLSDKSMRLVVGPGIDKSWLQAALSSPEARRQMSAVATGTSDSMRNISQEKVKSVRLRVPSFDEQRRIVAELDRRLSVADELRRTIEVAALRSAALRHSILERAFRGELVSQDPLDEPPSSLLARTRTGEAGAMSAATRGTVGT